LTSNMPNFASRRMVRPPVEPHKTPPRHGKHPNTSKMRTYLRWVTKASAVVIGSILAIAGISAFDFYNTLNRDNIILANSGDVDLNGPINFLLVGSDTRKGQGEEFGQVDSELADVIILLHISKDRKDAVVVSFPRDLLVSVPECPNPQGEPFKAKDRQQINATIASGGVACTHLVIENLTGLEIPFVAMIDFRGVIEMTNAVGGVEVVIDQPISDDYSQLYIDAGNHTLKGAQALAFLRTRHGIGDGSDLGRISNQQMFLMSLFTKVKQDGTLNNPIQLYSLASAAARNMRLSESITDVGTMVTLASALREVDSSRLIFVQIPTRVLSGAEEGRLEPVQDQAEVLFNEIKNDVPISLRDSEAPTG
jgi:LCP family protein required for cell wall assembly